MGQKKEFWEVETYEYWLEDEGIWSSERPASCLLQGLDQPSRHCLSILETNVSTNFWLYLFTTQAPLTEDKLHDSFGGLLLAR